MLHKILNTPLNEILNLNVKKSSTNVSIPSTASKQYVDIYVPSLRNTIDQKGFFFMLLWNVFPWTHIWKIDYQNTLQLVFICSKSPMKAPEQCVKSVQISVKKIHSRSLPKISYRKWSNCNTQKQSPGSPLKKTVLKFFAKFTRKHLCWSLFLNKAGGYNFIKTETPIQVFSLEHLFYRTPPVAISWCTFGKLEHSNNSPKEFASIYDRAL